MPTNGIEILLVEDNILEAELTIRALKHANMHSKLIHIKSGEEALDFVFARGSYTNRHEKNPKLILLDLKMPKFTGIQVLQELKSNELSKTIPVVILTSSNEDPDIEMCYRLGANSYIVKPVGYENFLSAVTSLGVYWTVHNQPPR